jgi:hypothetical protein
VDAPRRNFLSMGRCRFLSLRSLRGLLPAAKFLTTIRSTLQHFPKDVRKMNGYSGAVKCFAASCALSIFPLASFAQNYVQTNLVSDIPQVPNADGTSVTIDAHLKNVWGMSVSPLGFQ